MGKPNSLGSYPIKENQSSPKKFSKIGLICKKVFLKEKGEEIWFL
jgi:hypothetical protein